MGRLAHFFLDVDLRCSHNGLINFIKKKKIKIAEDDYIVFLNHKRSIVKMFCGSEAALLHYKKEGRVIDTNVIKLLPKFCGGKSIDMDGALKAHLEEVLRKRKK